MNKICLFLFFISSSVWAAFYPACPELDFISKKYDHKTDTLQNFSLPLETINLSDSLIYSVGFEILNSNLSSTISTKLKSSQTIDVNWKGNSQNIPKIYSIWLGDFKLDQSTPENLIQPWKGFWHDIANKEELSLLDKCTIRDCKIKFNQDELEYIVLGKELEGQLLKKATRELRFFEVIKNRMINFVTKKFLSTYEGTGLDFPQNQHIPKTLLQETQENNSNNSVLVLKGFGFEKFNPEPGKYKPVITLFYRECFLKKAGPKNPEYTSCTDTVIYNNHYFDLWLRYFSIFPLCKGKQTLVGLSEIMDIDQLKDGALTRMIMAPAMRSLVEKILEARIKAL